MRVVLLEDCVMWRYVVAFLLLNTPAYADAIDGDWCSAEKHLAIKGPQIILPSGSAIQGEYRRHEFLYQVPAADPDAGAQIYLQLQGEDYMSLYHLKDGKPVDPVAWQRCTPKITS
jgi:hypothetical protein